MKTFFTSLPTLCLCLFEHSAASIQPSHRQLIEGTPPLLFQGTLVNDLQKPIPNAHIQLWQTDPLGIYDHPNAAGSNALDETFQYCGTATTDDDGSFWFLTHRPGAYANRPTHFHYKVWMDGAELLTSQFYFADEDTNYSEMQVIELREYEFDTDFMGYATNKTIVLDMGLGGNGPFTPSDMEGPFYPVFDFFGFANDLINATFIASDEFDADGSGVSTSSPVVSNFSFSTLIPTSAPGEYASYTPQTQLTMTSNENDTDKQSTMDPTSDNDTSSTEEAIDKATNTEQSNAGTVKGFAYASCIVFFLWNIIKD